MITGDFNLILHDHEENKPRVNITWMTRFKLALDLSFLREIKLIGRRFTWSNEQQDPTMSHLDRTFCNVEWDEAFPAAKLLPQASSMSDHFPLLLVQDLIFIFVHAYHKIPPGGTDRRVSTSKSAGTEP
jgi:hypothetical protein